MRQQFQTAAQQTGVGINERNLHVTTGLRTASFTATVEQSLGGICLTTGTTIGSVSGSTAGWGPSLRAITASAWRPNLPYPQTPVIGIFALPAGTPPFALPQTQRFRVRMLGLDQFGNPIEEITPWITKSMTLASQMTFIVMSKVFSVVNDCYIATVNVSSLLSVASIGWAAAPDPTGIESSAITDNPFAASWNAFLAGAPTTTNADFVGTEANWGVGTPLLMEPYGPDMPFPSPDILGATGILLRQINTPTVLNTVARLPARGQIGAGGVAPTTGIAIGRSAAGFQGTPHKLGFFSSDDWTTKITGISLTGSSTRASQRPTAWLQYFEDSLQIQALVRTTVGTQRTSNATNNYPNG